MSVLEQSAAWKALDEHCRELGRPVLSHLFESDPQRYQSFHLEWQDFLLDYSKNWVTSKTMSLLVDLFNQSQVPEWTRKMFQGDKINFTEHRAVLHTALRRKSTDPLYIDGVNIMTQITHALDRMRVFSTMVRQGAWKGASGLPITDVINIGIGGSDLGPRMVCQSLRPYVASHLKIHFVSNIDGNQLDDVLSHIDPRRSLFLIVSKTFTTTETIENARSAREWLLRQYNEIENDNDIVAAHFVAISTNLDQVAQFGILAENMFPFWDWVGGRYSLWSAVGLSIMIAIGPDQFDHLLEGARDIDNNLQLSISNPDKILESPSVILALLGIWYNNFYHAHTHAILPYYQDLSCFTPYFQQGDMESNGKTIDRDGKRIGYHTGPIIWGEPGTNSQHSFFQLVHQGTHLIPSDFIAIANPHHQLHHHHHMLMANFFAQTKALAFGKNRAQVEAEFKGQGNRSEEINGLVPHKVFEGNHPTTSILIKALSPYTLGSLIAIYEHKIFIQGIIWRINSFDQWGVELGKQLAVQILAHLASEDRGDKEIISHDQSTDGLISSYKAMQAGGGKEQNSIQCMKVE